MGSKYAKLQNQNHHIRDSVAAFSLVELMVSIAIAGFLGLGMWALMSTENKTYGQQDNTSQMQQNLRAAVNKISADLLAAQGPQTTVTGVTWYTAAASWKPYSIAVNQLDILSCASGVVGIMANAQSAGNKVITLNSNTPYSQAGSFAANSYVMINGTELQKIQSVSTGANTITLTAGLANPYAPGASIQPLQWITYQIHNDNTLWRNQNDGSGAQLIANFVVQPGAAWVTEINAPNYAANPPDAGVLQITLSGLKPGFNAPSSTVTNTIHMRNV
jgi:type II secretory pathway pseudopilin PulG